MMVLSATPLSSSALTTRPTAVSRLSTMAAYTGLCCGFFGSALRLYFSSSAGLACQGAWTEKAQ